MQTRDVQKLSIPKNNVGGILGSFARKQQKSNVNMKGVTENSRMKCKCSPITRYMLKKARSGSARDVSQAMC